MAVSSVAEAADNWVAGVEGKGDKYQTAARATRGKVLDGLRRIGLSPGPKFTAAVQDTSKITAEKWTSGVAGKKQNFVDGYTRGINR